MSRIDQIFMSVLLLLAFIGLACGSSKNMKVIAPGGPISVNQESAERLKENFYQTIQEASFTHEAELRITNEEITSFLAIELTKTGQIPLSNPQVWFIAGKIYLTGQVNVLGSLNLNSMIIAMPVLSEGRVTIQVQEAQMGALDFPENILLSMTQTVNEALSKITQRVEVTHIEILNGEMLINGKLRYNSTISQTIR